MNKNWIYKLAILLLSLGVICIIFYSLTVVFSPIELEDLKYFLSAFSILTFTGLSSFILGSGMGFLFGIPKTNKEIVNTKDKYLANTNLEQVSDWLTKIIIGIGLTQLSSIGASIFRLSEKLAEGLPTIAGPTVGVNFIASLIVFYLVSGFLISYLLTRLKLTEEFETNGK